MSWGLGPLIPPRFWRRTQALLHAFWVEPKIKHASFNRGRQTIQNVQVFADFSVQIQEGKQEKIKEGLINSGESFETAGIG